MRITIVQGAFLPVPARRGGAIEKAWAALGEEFSARGHQVTHISRLCDGLVADETASGVRHIRIQGYDTPSRLWWLKALDLAYSLRVLAVLPRADILVTHTFFLPILARGLKSRGRQYVHVGRYPRGQMRWYRYAGALQAPSSPIANAIREEFAGSTHRIPQITTVGYPVPRMPVDVSTPRVKRLLYVGRIHPEKGLDLLIDAFGIFSARRRSQDWTLRLVGPWQTATGGGGQAYRDSLEAQARSLGLPVEFIGPIFDPAKLAEEYASASVFAYPSLAERGETFGLAVLEAMAAGLLPIVSGLACFRDFVDPGRTGFTFDHRVGGSANLAEALLHACSQVETDDGIALRMRLRAVADRFTVQAIADAHLRDFSGLLKNA